MHTNKINSHGIPTTSKEWYEWLCREEKKTIAAYLHKPTLLIADYNRERAIANDYEGREILELLQNANDQAAEVGQIGRVLIELSSVGLIVANTGLPFSPDGVSSLQTSHLSPKRSRRNHLIGNKGLGFRSILNWSSTPIILSHSLCIAYCIGHAKSTLKEMSDVNQELARLIETEAQGQDALILPLLLFPIYSANGDILEKIENVTTRKIFERSEELLIKDYDTVIGMPFDKIENHIDAIKQINEIRPEILLFAQNLGELSFRNQNGSTVVWRREGGNEIAKVFENEKLLGQWEIFRTSEQLPAAIRDSDQNKASNYEIVVAVPDQTSDIPRLLYSHFPTDIPLPLPVICHATLDLEQNRKHLLQNSKCNEYVLENLAKFLAKIAEILASKSSLSPWAGCSILIQNAEYSVELAREAFPEKLIEFAKTRRIVPTLNGNIVTPGEALVIPEMNGNWLPIRYFPEVVPIRNESDAKFLHLLGVPKLDSSQIKGRIIACNDLSLDERVLLIVDLLRQKSLKGAYTSALFLDSSGHSLPDSTRVFLLPANIEIGEFPDWTNLRFLSESMRNKLNQFLETKDSRDLQQKLSEFGLIEYSLANVIGALVAEANRAEKNKSEKKSIIRTDLLRTVFKLFSLEKDRSKRPSYPEKSQLYLPSQGSSEALANELYLGKGSSVAHGEITQSLYESWAPEKLVDFEDLRCLTENPIELREFLIWIGVAQWPRIIKERPQDNKYLQYILNTLKYPVQFEDKVVNSAKNATSAFVPEVQSIEGISEILKRSDPIAIAAWLSNDDRVVTWGRPSMDSAILNAFPDGVRNFRTYQGSLPSYLRWRIESTPWLKSSDEKALRPKDCVLGERVIEELFPRPEMPDVQALEKFKIQPREIIEGWQRAGVLTSLAYLERDDIYGKLLELPLKNPDGKLARPLYHWLLDASETALGGDGPNQREFLANGKMWGYKGKTEAYYPISDLHHVDTEGLPEALLCRLNIVALRKRVGNDRILRLFGVKPVERSGVKQKIICKNITFGSTQANIDFQNAKPYIHKLRQSQTSQITQQQSLKDLSLEICSTLRAEIIFEDVPFEYDLPVWGWVLEEKTLYIRSDPSKPMSLNETLFSDAIAVALASLFKIADGGDFARMLTCKEEDRFLLLQRLRGESVLEDLETIKAEYSQYSPRELIASFPISDYPTIVSQTSNETNTIHNNDSETKILSTIPESEINTPLKIVEEDHTANPGLAPRKLQIRIVTTLGAKTTNQHPVTDGNFCELKAIEFEESSIPRRWPLAVGQIMGTSGPGCDLLSFASQEACENFRKGLVRDLNTVERFIEVKGRGNPGASIELKGNELSAAELYSERYFLYRLFEVSSDNYELSILQNPLNHKEALQPAVHVTMQKVNSMQRFSLTGGMRKNEM